LAALAPDVILAGGTQSALAKLDPPAAPPVEPVPPPIA